MHQLQAMPLSDDGLLKCLNACSEECILRMQTLLCQEECSHHPQTWMTHSMLSHRASSPKSGVTWGCTQCTEDTIGSVS